MTAKEQIKDWMRQVFAWDFAEKQNIVRASMARGVGLNPEQYARPYPGSVTNTVINMAPTEEQAESPLPKAMTGPVGSMLGKVLGIGIPATAAGAGLVWLGTLLGQPASAPPPKPVELELRWKVIGGKMETEVVPIPKDNP